MNDESLRMLEFELEVDGIWHFVFIVKLEIQVGLLEIVALGTVKDWLLSLKQISRADY